MTAEQVDAVERYRKAVEAYAETKAMEAKLEDLRPVAKQKAILRILGTDNPLTGKLHSGSSAEAIVETDKEYAEYRALQREALMQSILMKGHMIAAQFAMEVSR